MFFGSLTINAQIGNKQLPFDMEKIKNGSCFGDFEINHENNSFHLGYEGQKKYSLTIYNRWGAPVFVTTDKTKKWYGKIDLKKSKQNGAPVPEGTYYYVVVIDKKECTGYVTVKR